MKKALITGVNGQDGSFLAEILYEKGYEVFGIVRRSSVNNTGRIETLIRGGKLTVFYGDVTDQGSVLSVTERVKPDEIYNLAAQSDVGASFFMPAYTAQVNAVGVLNVLESARLAGLSDKVKIYQASTSELFGRSEEKPQRETTPFAPCSPYAVSKQFGFSTAKQYREAYSMFVSNGILFNHESERRGSNFVTRKITLAAARIAAGRQNVLKLGNLDSKRDWGYAKDYCECMYLMLNREKSDDFIVATGVQHTVRDFCERAFRENGIQIFWRGRGIGEKGYDENGRLLVEVDPAFFRPSDVDDLLGDPSKAVRELGWDPQKTCYEELVSIMAHHDMKAAAEEK